MFYRGCMRRGVSLEVIVEEDDNYEGLKKCANSADCEMYHRHYATDERSKKQKREDIERWTKLARHRSVSCETLTVLDVGNDDLSQEEWNRDIRDWNPQNVAHDKNETTKISRKKILESRKEPTMDDDYDDDDDDCSTATTGNDERETSFPQYENTREENVESCRSSKDETETSGSSDAEDSHYDKVEPPSQFKDVSRAVETSVDVDTDADDHIYDRVSPIHIYKIVVEEAEPESIKSCSSSSSDGQQSDSQLSRAAKKAHSWLNDPFGADDDSWITVGELENIKASNNRRNSKPDNNLPKSEVVTSVEVQKPTIATIKELNKTNSHLTKGVAEVLNKSKGEFYEEPLVSVEKGKKLFDSHNGVAKAEKVSPEKLVTALENREILVIEKEVEPNDRTSTPTSGEEDLNSHQIPTRVESVTGRSSPKSRYNIHNKELHLEELPPPHTVSAVRQLFESTHNTRASFAAAQQFDYFDHVRSNPSSKIIRFDRGLHPLPSSGTHSPSTLHSLANKFPPSVNHLKEQLRHELTSITCDSGSGSSCYTSAAITTQRTISPSSSSERNAGVIMLRKPKIAKGFNVKKALQENPRYFHMRIKERISHEKNKKQLMTTHYVGTTKTCTSALQRNGCFLDRSDVDSLSSDSSDDSGVSRDFSSTIVSSFSATLRRKHRNDKNAKHGSRQRILPTDGENSSFKWIDPSILAKIRSVGTTVIYFGPRKRKAEKEDDSEEVTEYNGETTLETTSIFEPFKIDANDSMSASSCAVRGENLVHLNLQSSQFFQIDPDPEPDRQMRNVNSRFGENSIIYNFT